MGVSIEPGANEASLLLVLVELNIGLTITLRVKTGRRETHNQEHRGFWNRYQTRETLVVGVVAVGKV